MKKVLVAVLVIAVTLIAASSAMAVIANSKHDLSVNNTTGSDFHVTAGGLSSCNYCHTPHGSNTAVTSAPIWNRTTKPVLSYQLYASSSGGKTIGGTPITTIGDISLACLSCHDGTLSVLTTYAEGVSASGTAWNFGTSNVSASPNFQITGLPNIGQDLRNDHPVGMVVTGVTPTIAGLTTLAAMQGSGFLFFGGTNTMECGTCHDPHGSDSNTASPNAPFLRAAKNQLCTLCHVNK